MRSLGAGGQWRGGQLLFRSPCPCGEAGFWKLSEVKRERSWSAHHGETRTQPAPLLFNMRRHIRNCSPCSRDPKVSTCPRTGIPTLRSLGCVHWARASWQCAGGRESTPGRPHSEQAWSTPLEDPHPGLAFLSFPAVLSWRLGHDSGPKFPPGAGPAPPHGPLAGHSSCIRLSSENIL